MENNKRFTTTHAMKIFVVALAVSMGLSLLLQFIKSNDIRTLLSIIIPQLSYLVFAIVFIKKDQFTIKEIIPRDIGVYPLGILLCLPIAIAVLAQNLFFATAVDWLAVKMGIGFDINLDMTNPAILVVSILSVAILPAICEEVMFRGVMLTSMRDKGLRYAVIVSALIFALSHMNIKQLVHPFIIGVLLAYITIKTCNITYAMCIHFLNNTMALFMGNIPFVSKIVVYSPKNAGILVGIMFAGLFALIPLVYLLLKATQSKRRHCTYNQSTSPYEKASEKPVRKIDTPILIICVVLVALTIATIIADLFIKK